MISGKTIRPVCLPRSYSDPAGKQGIVVGWGRTSEGGTLPGIVQEVNVPILSLAQCRAMKYRASRITPNMVSKAKETLYLKMHETFQSTSQTFSILNTILS